MFVSSSIANQVAGNLSDPAPAQEEHRPLTVLQVVARMDSGTAARATLEVAEAIVREGGRALIATSAGQMLPRVAKVGGEVVAMNLDTRNPLNIWQNARLLAGLIADLGVDIVHARSRAPAWSAYRAAQRTGAHFLATYNGNYNEVLPLKRRYNGIMARGRPVIAVSEFVKARIVERHGVPPDQIVVVPEGADTLVFAEEKVGNERSVKLAGQWGFLDNPRPVILLRDGLARRGGAGDLIDAADRLRAMRGTDFLILIVGEDDGKGHGETLRKRIDRLGLMDFVHLVGGCADMAAAYKLASVVVTTTLDPEPFDRAIVEAQAMGRPVVATDHGSAREIVRHGESGWLYPPGDVERLAGALNEALSLDPSGRAHMGMAARARAHARYTVAAMQRATLDVYERVTGRTFARLI